MPNLLFKEWMVNRSTILLIVVLMFINSMLFKGQMMGLTSMALGCFYPFISGMSEYRNNGKEDILMNSLPVERREIVASKYIFALLFGSCLILVGALINRLIPSFEGNFPFVVPLAISIVGWFVSIYYPLFYLFGPRNASYVLLVLIMGGSFFFQYVGSLDSGNGFLESFESIQRFSVEQLSITFLGITIIILLISWFISGQIYRHKQF